MRDAFGREIGEEDAAVTASLLDQRLRDVEFRRRYSESLRQRDRLYTEVKALRRRQDEQWGGPDHDDEHGPADWLRFISRQVALAGAEPDRARERLVNVIALGFAAVASLDRQAERQPEPPPPDAPVP